MNTHTTTAAGQEPYTVDDLQIEVNDLRELLTAMYDILHEMDYERDGKRDQELDRVAALARIAKDYTQRIDQNISRSYRSFKAGEAAK